MPDHFYYGFKSIPYDDVTESHIEPFLSDDGGVSMKYRYIDINSNTTKVETFRSSFIATKEDKNLALEKTIAGLYICQKEYKTHEGFRSKDTNLLWFARNFGCPVNYNLHCGRLKLNSYSVDSCPNTDWEVQFLASRYFESIGIDSISFTLRIEEKSNTKYHSYRDRVNIIVHGILKDSLCPVEVSISPDETVTDDFLMDLTQRDGNIPDVILKQCYGYDKEHAGGFYSGGQWTWVAICEERDFGKGVNTQKHQVNSRSSIAKKPDFKTFQEYLSENGVDCFYHFTDEENLKSIKENGGLYSWKYCVDNGITISHPGGSRLSRELDMRYGLSDYVRLSFCDDHPMVHRLSKKGYNLVLLMINPEVALLKDTLFSDMNATDSSHHHGGRLEDLKRVNIEATQQGYISSSSPLFKLHQAEVLVKTFIPIEYITNIDDPDYL